ncbi:MAG: DUF805 domain-containing protein [Thiothrix litoralis]
MKWYFYVLKNYAKFTGRGSRSEYWYYTLVNLIIFAIFMILLNVAGASGVTELAMGAAILFLLYALATLIPSIAVAVRRLHDTGRSGWWMLLAVVPIASLVLLVFMVLDSQAGDNQYGKNPKA